MDQAKNKKNILKPLLQAPGRFLRFLAVKWSSGRVALRNKIRRWRKFNIDYIVLPLSGSFPERAAPKRGFIERRLPLPPPPPSLEGFNKVLQAICDADNVRGVVFLFQGLQTGLATTQNLRRSFQRLKEAGKEVVVYTPYLDLRNYFLAAAADRIIVPPGTQFDVLGLHAEVVFLKDALEQIGVQMDVVQISPYKTALDMLQHSEITPEHRAQLEWLLDDQYDIITTALAAGRSQSLENIKSIIDGAPYSILEAKEKGLIDDIGYEDELPHLLAVPNGDNEQQPNVGDNVPAALIEENPVREDGGENSGGKNKKAKIIEWPKARKMITQKWRRQTRQQIGVVSLEGMISMGPSRRSPLDLPIPLIGGAVAGEQTLLKLLRTAESDDRLAALILHIDSGGGSALASDLIGREVQRLSRKKPVLVYMGNVAASGGYYVSAYAQHIMSQTSTMTGSIGVISARPSTQDLYNRLRVNRVSLKRGQHADLYTDLAPMTTDERQIFWDIISENYARFKQVVSDGRDLPYDQLDVICEGRVWTGRQAKSHRLVDSHGDFEDAIVQAAALAEMTVDENQHISVTNLALGGDGYSLPQPFETVKEIERLLSQERLQMLVGRPLLLMPFDLKWH